MFRAAAFSSAKIWGGTGEADATRNATAHLYKQVGAVAEATRNAGPRAMEAAAGAARHAEAVAVIHATQAAAREAEASPDLSRRRS